MLGLIDTLQLYTPPPAPPPKSPHPLPCERYCPLAGMPHTPVGDDINGRNSG